MRFDPGITGTVPAPITGRAPASQPGAPAQPYPGDMTASQAPYDRTYTGSVPAQGTARLAPPTNVQPVYQRSPQAGQRNQATVTQPAPVYRAQPESTVTRQPLRNASAPQAAEPRIQLAPVPVVTAKTADASTAAGRPATITRTVEVPVARIPTPSPARRGPVAVRVAEAPAQAFPQGTATHNPAPDPIITGTTPGGAATRQEPGNGWTTTGGTRVTMAAGETIYNLSRRYGVPANEILRANNIGDPSRVRSGQIIVIPTYVYSRRAPVSAPDNDPKTRAARASTGYEGEVRTDRVPLPRPAPSRKLAVLPSTPAARSSETEREPVKVASAPAKQGATYEVQSGDSLNRIASRSGVTVEALKRANNLDTSMIRVGQTLTIPAGGAELDSVKTASVPRTPERPKSTAAPAPAASVAEQATVKAETPKTTGIGKLRWPAKGQVMSRFGTVEGGSKNDGIDISLPNGTPVKAAENGVVIYSGSGLKEYGNTVLVRHANGLVSVYGHASELVVKRGDKVSRGQVVALSGMSGQAKRPKLHFEIRKDAKPVDPLTYLE